MYRNTFNGIPNTYIKIEKIERKKEQTVTPIKICVHFIWP